MNFSFSVKMDDEDKDEVHLVSMMPVNNDDEMDSEYHIDGVNVAEYLPGTFFGMPSLF